MLKKKQKPVTIITGYLGAGKTTVINELLRSKKSDGMGIIINDMGSVNIDASLIKNSDLFQKNTTMVELTNGCICCTLKDEFMKQINDIAAYKNVDRILVEASGISDPSAIAAGFLQYEQMGYCERIYLDSIVCVVDADRVYREFIDDLIQEHGNDKNNDPDIINLVVDQIEFSNVILLNKCDMLSVEEKEKVRYAVRVLQKTADIVECIHGKVNPDRIFKSTKFDYEKAMSSSRIQEQLLKGTEEIKDEHGIVSFLYEERRPFNYDKFMKYLEKDYPEGIIRAKGFMWFNDDDIHVQLFEQVGRNASVTIVSNWLAAFSEEERNAEIKDYPESMDGWDEKYGDRINQIVFIGKNINSNKIYEQLDKCLDE